MYFVKGGRNGTPGEPERETWEIEGCLLMSVKTRGHRPANFVRPGGLIIVSWRWKRHSQMSKVAAKFSAEGGI